MFCKRLEKQVEVEIIRILSYFQEEMMVQEDPIYLEEKKKSKEKKQIKTG